MRPYVFERNRCILKVNNRKGVSNPHTHVERSESANARLSKSSHTIKRGDVSLYATTSECKPDVDVTRLAWYSWKRAPGSLFKTLLVP